MTPSPALRRRYPQAQVAHVDAGTSRYPAASPTPYRGVSNRSTLTRSPPPKPSPSSQTHQDFRRRQSRITGAGPSSQLVAERADERVVAVAPRSRSSVTVSAVMAWLRSKKNRGQQVACQQQPDRSVAVATTWPWISRLLTFADPDRQRRTLSRHGSQRQPEPDEPGVYDGWSRNRGSQLREPMPVGSPGLSATLGANLQGEAAPRDSLRPAQTADSCLGVKGSRGFKSGRPDQTLQVRGRFTRSVRWPLDV